jgi:hypothetical protein
LPPELADANVSYVRSDGPRVTVCYGNGDNSPGSVTACLVLDETGEVLGPREFADAERARSYERELPSPVFDVEVDEGITRPGVASLDKTRAFIFAERDGHFHGVFHDLRTQKQIGDVDLARLDIDSGAFTLPYHLREARFVGTRILVTDRVEVGPTYHAFLVSSSGDHIAVGDETSSYTVVDDELIVVIAGKELRLVDVAKLAKVGTLVAPGKTSPLADVLVVTFSDKLVVAHARPAGVFFVDRTNHQKTTERAIPICR